MTNPLLQPWDTPYGLPPFDRVRVEDFAPAFEVAMRDHLAELDALAADPAAPTFANTVAAFDRSGRLLGRLEGLFFNLSSSCTSPELQAAERELAPRLAAHGNQVAMHRGLFARIDAVHAKRAQLQLDAEALRVLERIHFDFVRAGARLAPAVQARYGEVTEKLAELTTQFAQNVLADESSYALELRTEADLQGLPEFVRMAARAAAQERGSSAGHVVTLARAHVVPFLTFSSRRDLREAIWRAWTSRGEHDGPHDNRGLARDILTLRNEQARLHGYASYADYVLVDTMAGQRAAVDALLHKVWEPAKVAAEAERRELEALAAAHGETLQIEPWDWRYFAEQLRRERFAIDEAEVKPYFVLERIVEAAFDCAQRLFGVRFVAQPHVRTYHSDVQVYEVRDRRDAVIGVFLHDNFARPNKRSGAWMSSYRQQTRNTAVPGQGLLPIVVNNNNFARGSSDAPTLLSFDDARTLFHEFGHGLHGLLSNVTYERLSGTSVLRDFVELPSQLYEHWLSEPAVLQKHARHYQTGAPIPADLVARLTRAQKFNQGFETVRYLASALVDMAVHARPDAQGPDIVEFERAELQRLGLPRGTGVNHRLPHFQHLFSGLGYAAGYYVYLWAEVLDADGYEAFVEAGDPFDAETALRLLANIYSAGNSQDPAAAYRTFRGRDPRVEPMLRKKGLVGAPA